MSKTDLHKPGELVFAKIKGHPAWPAKIDGNPVKEKPIPKYKVIFFGTGEHGIVAGTDIFSYNKGTIKKYGKPSKRKGFTEGLQEIEKYARSKNIDLGKEEEEKPKPKSSSVVKKSTTKEKEKEKDIEIPPKQFEPEIKDVGTSASIQLWQKSTSVPLPEKSAPSVEEFVPSDPKSTPIPTSKKSTPVPTPKKSKAVPTPQKESAPVETLQKSTPLQSPQKEAPIEASQKSTSTIPPKKPRTGEEENEDVSAEVEQSAMERQDTEQVPIVAEEEPKASISVPDPKEDDPEKSADADPKKEIDIYSHRNGLPALDLLDQFRNTEREGLIKYLTVPRRPLAFRTESAKFQWETAANINIRKFMSQLDSGEYMPKAMEDDLRRDGLLIEKEEDPFWTPQIEFIAIEERLLEVDYEIKQCLDITLPQPKLQRVESVFQCLSLLAITPQHLMRCPQIVHTVRKCMDYDQSKLVQIKAGTMYNRFKAMFMRAEGESFLEAYERDALIFTEERAKKRAERREIKAQKRKEAIERGEDPEPEKTKKKKERAEGEEGEGSSDEDDSVSIGSIDSNYEWSDGEDDIIAVREEIKEMLAGYNDTEDRIYFDRLKETANVSSDEERRKPWLAFHDDLTPPPPPPPPPSSGDFSSSSSEEEVEVKRFRARKRPTKKAKSPVSSPPPKQTRSKRAGTRSKAPPPPAPTSSESEQEDEESEEEVRVTRKSSQRKTRSSTSGKK